MSPSWPRRAFNPTEKPRPQQACANRTAPGSYLFAKHLAFAGRFFSVLMFSTSPSRYPETSSPNSVTANEGISILNTLSKYRCQTSRSVVCRFISLASPENQAKIRPLPVICLCHGNQLAHNKEVFTGDGLLGKRCAWQDPRRRLAGRQSMGKSTGQQSAAKC